MNRDTVISRNEISSNLLEGRPLKSYKKTILGKILLKVWDSMVNTEDEIVFAGDPRRGDEAVFHVYSEHERIYFERANRNHFKTGALINIQLKEEPQETVRPYEQYTDEELKEIINSRFYSLTSTLDDITSTAVLFRIISLAGEMEKSDKIIKAIEARLSEVQDGEFATKRANTED